MQLALSIKYWAHEAVELSNDFVYTDRQRAGSFMGDNYETWFRRYKIKLKGKEVTTCVSKHVFSTARLQRLET